MPTLNRKVVRPKLGKRADLGGQFVRSAMEADTARVLQVLVDKGAILGWCFEPRTFMFAGKCGANGRQYLRGPWAYTPDFLIWHDRAELSGKALDWRNLWRDCAHDGEIEACMLKPPDFGQTKPLSYNAFAAKRWHGISGFPPLSKICSTTLHPPLAVIPAHILGEYVEVKGREVGTDRSKRKRMAKHYPGIPVTQVGAHEFFILATVFAKSIPLWETRTHHGAPRRRRR